MAWLAKPRQNLSVHGVLRFVELHFLRLVCAWSCALCKRVRRGLEGRPFLDTQATAALSTAYCWVATDPGAEHACILVAKA